VGAAVRTPENSQVHWLIEQFKWLIGLADPENLRQLVNLGGSWWVCYAVLGAVIFSETGLLVGFFLPGDSLLFTVGVVCGAGDLNIALVNVLLMCAALLGDTSGYLLGRSTGPHIFNRPNSRIFRREYLTRTHEFYEKYGGKTMIYAHFIPIIRTFAAFVAGVGRMNLVRFISFDVFGVTGWVFLMTMAGYTRGGVPFVRHYFDKVILVIIAISLLPAGIEALRARGRLGDAETRRRGDAS
jgi:membrane-associated protein